MVPLELLEILEVLEKMEIYHYRTYSFLYIRHLKRVIIALEFIEYVPIPRVANRTFHSELGWRIGPAPRFS